MFAVPVNMLNIDTINMPSIRVLSGPHAVQRTVRTAHLCTYVCMRTVYSYSEVFFYNEMYFSLFIPKCSSIKILLLFPSKEPS